MILVEQARIRLFIKYTIYWLELNFHPAGQVPRRDKGSQAKHQADQT
jgi:hypothetical protein